MSRIWIRFKDTGNEKRQPGQGQKPVPTSCPDRYLATIAKRYRQVMPIQSVREFAATTGIRLSKFTVINLMHKKSLYAR